MIEQMVDEDMFKTMLDTIITSQEKLDTKVTRIETTMIEVVRIEERQANQKEAIQRLGKAVDKQEDRVDDLEKLQATSTAKYNSIAGRVTIIASGIATVVTGVILMVIKYMFTQ